MSKFPEWKNMLKIRESKLQSLKDENLNLLDFKSKKLKKLNSVFNCLVSKYEKLKIERMETEKNLELSINENNRFKLVTDCLMKNIKEPIDYMVDGCLEKNDRLREDVFSLQVIKIPATSYYRYNK